MNGMGNMYGQPYPDMASQVAMNGYAQQDNMDAIAATHMDPIMMDFGSAQTLDQIINHNNQEMIRRRQTYNPMQRQQRGQQDQQDQQGQQAQQATHPSQIRRQSMLEFSSSYQSDLADFQFDPSPQQAAMSTHIANINNMAAQKQLDPRRVRSKEDLSLDTRFEHMQNYDAPSMSAYPASMIPNSAMSMDSPHNFLSNVELGGGYGGISPADMNQMNLTSSQARQAMYSTSPVAANFSIQYPPTGHDPGGDSVSPANTQTVRMRHGPASNVSTPQRFMNKPHNQLRRGPIIPSPLALAAQSSNTNSMPSPSALSTNNQQRPTIQPHSRRTSMDLQSPFINQSNNDMGMNMGMGAGMGMGMSMNVGIGVDMDMSQAPSAVYKNKWANAYSNTGFDMLAILMRVATRRNPQINIGPVDLACAFVVCDIQKHDTPIVYCSDMFERLTGYSRHEILGRNCRFLQAPDGKVQSGTKRKYVDDKSVLYLKNQCNSRAEAQLSLINYKKGGQPFMNLLTMIPITWDTEEFKYFVGFQVDLVEQPNSVSAKNPDGTYEINYNRSALPAYRLPAPDHSSALENMSGQTISRDEVSQVLATIGNGETELSRRVWDKVLLENTDDVVHVLSLKGLFLYLSPACKLVLEYEPSELVGTALSSVCHPSDIVPVTRELKDSSNGQAVNVVYRIRRKTSGYTWFEAHGALHTEQGKGRKCIILVGRQRPVYTLEKSEITVSEGVVDAELWTKLSTTGMFLYVSSTSRSMLDRLPDDLVGTSMQLLMRPDSRKEFGRVLELARMGEKSTFKHDMQNRRGQVLQAQTTIYPGDAKQGLKPTFLLGQTRLLKMTRAMLLSQKSATSVPHSDASTAMAAPGLSAPNTQEMVGMDEATATDSFVGTSGILTQAGSGGVPIGTQDEALASEDNIFDELKTTRSTSWQFELRQMERQNRILAEDLQALLMRKKKRKRRKGQGSQEKDCANCHTKVTPEWRRGPSGQRDLCNSCGLRWAKQNGRVSPRKSGQSDKSNTSPRQNGSVPTPRSRDQSGSKEASAETKPTPMSEMSEILNQDKTPMQMKQESREFGNMPSVIEEGLEPPHPNVLPA